MPDDVGGHSPELDFAVVRDGAVILGEAKKDGRLGGSGRESQEKLGRIVRAAHDLLADQICFATTAQTWSEENVAMISHALESSTVTPTYLTGLGRH